MGHGALLDGSNRYRNWKHQTNFDHTNLNQVHKVPQTGLDHNKVKRIPYRHYQSSRPPPPTPKFSPFGSTTSLFLFSFSFFGLQKWSHNDLGHSESKLSHISATMAIRFSGFRQFWNESTQWHQNYLNNYKPKHNHIYIVICYKWLQISLSFHLPPVVFELLAFLRNVHRSPQWA